MMDKDALAIAEYVVSQLKWHRDCVEECTCIHDIECWYRQSDKEMHRARLEFLIGKLQEELEETQ